MYDEKKYVAWLHTIDGIGQITLRNILNKCSAQEVYNLSNSDYKNKFNLKDKVIEGIVKSKKNNKLDEISRIIDKYSIDIISINDDIYPKLLKKIYDPPSVIYVRGQIQNKKCDIISVIGSRKASSYGRCMAYKISSQLSQNGIIVCSGMASGIDTVAHKACIESGGITYGILGTGIDKYYPKSNKELMEKTILNGALISEFPIGTMARPENFPRRNRLISGISKGVVVVEAALKSGTLITVDCALEQGREIFAVPGPISSPLSSGTNKLIQNGAKLISHVEDIIEEIQLEDYYNKKDESRIDLSNSEKEIYEYIKANEPVSIEKIQIDIKWSIENINTTLTFLELKGILKTLPGNKYFIN